MTRLFCAVVLIAGVATFAYAQTNIGQFSLVNTRKLEVGTPTVGGSEAIARIRSATAAIDFGATAANTCDDGATTIAVTGAADGDPCLVGGPDSVVDDANTSFTCYVSAADVATVRRCCEAAVACTDPASVTFRAVVIGY